MPTKAHIRFAPLKTTLANLPLSLYNPLVSAQKRPQALALHVLAKGKASYLGWSGMSSPSSGGGKDWLEVDPGVGASFGWEDGQEVEISVVHDLKKAESVSVAPLTAEDWEIISSNAGWLEQNLLFHVRGCTVGQVLEVWVRGKMRVRMRVEALTPTPKGKVEALLLSQDTEIVISPLLRPAPTPAPVTSSAPTKLVSKPTSTTKSSSNTPSTPRPPPNAPTLRVLPARLLPRAPPSPPSTPPVDDVPSPKGRYALLSFDSFSLLPPSTSASTSSSKPGWITLARVAPPGVDTSPPPLDGEAGGQDEEKIGQTTIRVVQDPSVPFGHVVLCSSGGRGAKKGGMEDWDLVRAWASSTAPVEDESGEETEGGGLSESEEKEGEKERARLRALPGVAKVREKAMDFLVGSMVLQSGVFFSSPGSNQRSSDVARILLLTGGPGSGKSTLARSLALGLEEDSRVFAHTLSLSLPPLSSAPLATIRSSLTSIIAQANHHAPSCIILDGLDSLCGPEMEHVDTTRTRLIAEMVVSLFGPGPTNGLLPGVVVVATAKSEADVHPLLASKHIFGERVSLGSLNKDSRREILEHLVESKLASSPLQLDSSGRGINYVSLAGQTEGYSVSDLLDFTNRAVQAAVVRSLSSDAREVRLGAEDFDAAQKGFVPLSLRDVKLHHSEVKWSDIGGLHPTRRTLRETLEWPTKYGAIFKQSPLRLRSGLLLYGYPGCGKTLLASAVAKECGLNFISVKGPEILNKYIGASEKSVRDLFDRASAAKPCVLFFDEFDSIAPKRGHDSTGVTDRVVNQMLTQMDGAEGLDGVYVLAATSRPDLIDPALLRPGRLDKSLLCPMPSYEDRLEILSSLTRSLHLSPSISLPQLASQTEFFSGADLGGLIGTAHLAAVHSSIDVPAPSTSSSSAADKDVGKVVTIGGSGKDKTRSRAEDEALKKRVNVMFSSSAISRPSSNQPKPAAPKEIVISPEHLQEALRTARPSVPKAERERLGKIYAEFEGVEERSKGEGGMRGAEGGGTGTGTRVSLG